MVHKGTGDITCLLQDITNHTYDVTTILEANCAGDISCQIYEENNFTIQI